MRKVILTVMVALAFVFDASAQVRTISGRVLDDKGAPVAGVSVTSPGGRGTQTDRNGNYTLNVTQDAKTLTFSAVNYAAQTITLGNSTTVNVNIGSAGSNLAEVVVAATVNTGYGTKPRSQFTGAAAKVSGKETEQLPFGSFENMLQGQAPGLYIASGSGQPGASARVNIRGVGSLNGGQDPLYILDGVPIEAAVFRTLNPNDFESFDVLKDAASAGLYGSRGGNGVIVITTKRGRSGRLTLQYRGQAGFSNPPQQNNNRLMNTEERLRYEGEFLGPAGVIGAGTATGYPGWDYSPSNPAYQALPAATQTLFAGRLDSIRKINTDWASIFFRNSTFRQHEINASGGSQNLSFYSSLAFYGQEGVLQRSELERYTLRNNVDFKTDRLTVSFHTTAGYSILKGVESESAVALANPVAAAYLELPYKQLYKAPNVIDTGAGKIGPNAFDRANTTTATTNQFKGNIAFTMQFLIWKGLSVKTTNGVDYRNNNTSRFIDPNQYAGSLTTGFQGSYNEGNSENVQFINTTGLTYDRTFGGKHRVTAQALSESIREKNRNFNATGFGLNRRLENTPAAITPGSVVNGVGSFIPLIGGGKSIRGISSIIGLADYTFNRKVTVSGVIRRDAASQASPNFKSKTTGSGGIVYNLHEEKFLQSLDVFDELRVRASRGEVASVNGFPSDFGYIPSFGVGGAYAGVAGIVPTSPGNPDYKIETQVQTNIGADFTLWNRRLRIVADVYKKESRNLFVLQPLSRTTGFPGGLNTNVGKMENRGLDFSVSADVVKSSAVSVTVGINGGFLKNRITDLGVVPEVPAGTGIYRVGLAFGTHYQVEFLGVNPVTGLPVYADINGNPTTDYSAANNRATFGTYLPSFTGGASLDVTWKGFEFNTLFTTAQDVNRFNNESFFYEATNANFQYNKSVRLLESWRNSGEITDFQKINSARQFSSKDIRDASFVRFRNLQVGYTFVTKNNKPIRGFRVWGQGQNLFTWTKWTGFDPEESNNIANYEFPNPRTYTLGLDINF